MKGFELIWTIVMGADSCFVRQTFGIQSFGEQIRRKTFVTAAATEAPISILKKNDREKISMKLECPLLPGENTNSRHCSAKASQWLKYPPVLDLISVLPNLSQTDKYLYE